MGVVSSIVTLRKLTRKSLIGDALKQYSDKTVQWMLDNHLSGKLSWIYYIKSKVTFTDDILDEIPIYENERINKPGSNIKMYKKRLYSIANSMNENGNPSLLYKLFNNKVKARRKRVRLEHINEITNFSKAAMQARNHGHFGSNGWRK